MSVALYAAFRRRERGEHGGESYLMGLLKPSARYPRALRRAVKRGYGHGRTGLQHRARLDKVNVW